jgi:hypothetical protein
MFALPRTKKKPDDWVVREKLSPADFNAAGAVNVCATALVLDQFDFAADWIEKVPHDSLEERRLLYLRARSAWPAPYRWISAQAC